MTENELESMRNRLRALREEHRELDGLIATITAKPYLTPEEQLEVARLKKLKLKKKDEIYTMATQLGEEI